jgi:hypothetical protein
MKENKSEGKKTFQFIFIQVITLHHPILHEMIVNQLYRDRHLKQVVVQQVLQNEVLMKVQQQHRIHQVYIQMKIHQVQIPMNNSNNNNNIRIQSLNVIKCVGIICHMLKFLNEFFPYKNVQY